MIDSRQLIGNFCNTETHQNSQTKRGKGKRRIQGRYIQLTKVGRSQEVVTFTLAAWTKVPMFYYYFHTFLTCF